eukprot:scaffold2129_cov107-Isochrysis_galbana.AAC.6
MVARAGSVLLVAIAGQWPMECDRAVSFLSGAPCGESLGLAPLAPSTLTLPRIGKATRGGSACALCRGAERVCCKAGLRGDMAAHSQPVSVG